MSDPLPVLTHTPTQGYFMRYSNHVASRVLPGLAILALLSCTDSTAPEARAESDLHLLHVSSASPSLAATQVSFYAVKGKPGGADLWYHAQPGQTDSLKFVGFRVGAASLDQRPDGSAIAQGDSILITLTVSDPTHLVVTLEPSGLKFSSSDQPTFRMFWVACGDDLNYDGKVDAADTALTQQFSIWRQETAGQPWIKLSSVVVGATKEVDGQLSGFTGYALAY
jgi:hypothetical protein